MPQKNGTMVNMPKIMRSTLEWRQNTADAGYYNTSNSATIHQANEAHSEPSTIG